MGRCDYATAEYESSCAQILSNHDRCNHRFLFNHNFFPGKSSAIGIPEDLTARTCHRQPEARHGSGDLLRTLVETNSCHLGSLDKVRSDYASLFSESLGLSIENFGVLATRTSAILGISFWAPKGPFWGQRSRASRRADLGSKRFPKKALSWKPREDSRGLRSGPTQAEQRATEHLLQA